MTTIAANRERMAADTWISYAPSFEGKPKIWVAKHSIWGAGGPSHACNSFKLWTLGLGKKPKFRDPDSEDEDEDSESSVKLEVLQLHYRDGLFLWANDNLPDAIAESHYAIGSGAGLALGAMDMGATPEQAIAVAARHDSGTREPINILSVRDIKRKR